MLDTKKIKSDVEKIKLVEIEDEAAFFDLFDQKTVRGGLLFYMNDKDLRETPEFSFFVDECGENVRYSCNSERVNEYFIKRRNMKLRSEHLTYEKI